MEKYSDQPISVFQQNAAYKDACDSLMDSGYMTLPPGEESMYGPVRGVIRWNAFIPGIFGRKEPNPGKHWHKFKMALRKLGREFEEIDEGFIEFPEKVEVVHFRKEPVVLLNALKRD